MNRVDFSRGGRDHAPLPTALATYKIDIWADDEAPTPCLFQYKDGTGLIARKNLHVIKGREKTGKSAFGMLLATAAMCMCFLGVSPRETDLRVLWIDTEQDTGTLKRRARKTVEMAQNARKGTQLILYSLKGLLPAERLKIALEAIEQERPDFVLLDGAADLCADFNDNKESAAVVNALLAATEKIGCAILCVIHTNKRDDEARGHMGSILQQKAAEVYEIKKGAEGIVTVSQAVSRFASVPDIRFTIGDGFSLLPTVEVADKIAEDMRAIFADLPDGQAEMSRQALCKAITERRGVQSRQAGNIISSAIQSGALVRTKKGAYSLATDYMFGELINGENEE